MTITNEELTQWQALCNKLPDGRISLGSWVSEARAALPRLIARVKEFEDHKKHCPPSWCSVCGREMGQEEKDCQVKEPDDSFKKKLAAVADDIITEMTMVSQVFIPSNIHWFMDKEPAAEDRLRCIECNTFSVVTEWEDADVCCGDCGSHAAIKCPICKRIFDHVYYADDFLESMAESR